MLFYTLSPRFIFVLLIDTGKHYLSNILNPIQSGSQLLFVLVPVSINLFSFKTRFKSIPADPKIRPYLSQTYLVVKTLW